MVCRKYFELFTFQHCNSGDELLISYGADKCNFELMRDYGFVLEGSTLSRDRIHFVFECQCLLRDRGANISLSHVPLVTSPFTARCSIDTAPPVS